MPAKSQQQMKYIYAMRHKYGSKRKAPKSMKWLFDEEWTSGVKMKKLPKKVKKNESHIMSFSSFVNENYTFEDFTTNDMEFVKELWEEGMTDIGQLAIESDLTKEIVQQIVDTLKSKGEINESEQFDDHEDQSGCVCDICNCVGECNCGCCCGEDDNLHSCGCTSCECENCDMEQCECPCCK